MFTHFLHHIHPPAPLLCHLPTPKGATLGQDLFYLLFSDFVEEREEIKRKT
jgi:hypothetical protein